MADTAVVKEAASAVSQAKSVFTAIAGAGQGSVAAMGLAGIAGLLTVTVAGIAYEVHEHKEEEFLKQAHQAQELKKKFMPKGPDIFTFDEQNKKLTSAKAIVLNADMRKDLAEDKSLDNDSFLIQFKKVITESLKFDLDFFDERVKHSKAQETDPTASVLTWIMEIKKNHMLSFEGYDQDLIYLEQLIALMKGFVEIPRDGIAGFFLGHDPKDRQRFNMLVGSIKKLQEAYNLLYSHKDSRTMKDFVDEMMSVSNKDFVPELTSLFIEAIIPEGEWGLIQNARDTDLAQGNLRPEEERHGLIRYLAKTKQPVAIPESVFKKWLRTNLVNFNNKKTEDKLDYTYHNVDVEHAAELFKTCNNIFTRKAPQRQADGKLPDNRFVAVGQDKSCYVLYVDKLPIPPVSDYYLVKDAKGWALYETNPALIPVKIEITDVPGLKELLVPPKGKPLDLHLSHSDSNAVNQAITHYRNRKQTISRIEKLKLFAQCQEMEVDAGLASPLFSDAIRDLGVIYMETPSHCNFIIGAYKAFGDMIVSRADALLKGLMEIDQELVPADDLLIGLQNDMAVNLRNKLTQIREKTTAFCDNIMARHNAHSARIGDAQAAGPIDTAVYDQDKDPKNPDRGKAIKPLIDMMAKLVSKYDLKLPQPHDLTAIQQQALERTGAAPSSSSLSLSITSSAHPAVPPKPSKPHETEGFMDHFLNIMHFKRGPAEDKEKEEKEKGAGERRASSPDPVLPNFTDAPPSPSVKPLTGGNVKPQPVQLAEAKGTVPAPQPQQPAVQPQQPAGTKVVGGGFTLVTTHVHDINPVEVPQPTSSITAGLGEAKDKEDKQNGPENKDNNPSNAADDDDDDNLETLLTKVQTRINEIGAQEKPDRETRRAYNELYRSLANFESHSKKLMLDKDHERQAKGQVIKDLGADLAKDTLKYLRLDLSTRKSSTVTFHDDVKEKMSSPGYKAIDEHKNLFSHVMRALKQVLLCLCLGYGIYDAVKEGGFAITATRRLANQMQSSTNTLEKKFRQRVR